MNIHRSSEYITILNLYLIQYIVTQVEFNSVSISGTHTPLFVSCPINITPGNKALALIIFLSCPPGYHYHIYSRNEPRPQSLFLKTHAWPSGPAFSMFVLSHRNRPAPSSVTKSSDNALYIQQTHFKVNDAIHRRYEYGWRRDTTCRPHAFVNKWMNE